MMMMMLYVDDSRCIPVMRIRKAQLIVHTSCKAATAATVVLLRLLRLLLLLPLLQVVMMMMMTMTMTVTISHQQDSSSVRGNKLLNSAMSISISNARQSGELALLSLPAGSTLVPSITCDCVRHVNLAEFRNSSTFTGALQRVYESQTLRIGVSASTTDRRFAIVNGTAQGYLPEVGNLVAHHMGLLLNTNIRAEFIPFAPGPFFETSRDIVNSGTVDTTFDVSYSVVRSSEVDFSCCYEDSRYLAAFRDRNTHLPGGLDEPESLSDLNQPFLIVGVYRGSIADEVISRYLPLTQKLYFTVPNDAVNAVGRRVHITVQDEYLIELYNEDNDERLVEIPNTRIRFAGGNSFITKKF